MSSRLSAIAPTVGVLAAVAILAPAAPTATGLAPAREFAPREVIVKFEGEGRGEAVKLPRGVGVRTVARALRDNPRVAYAEPNYIARASAPGFDVPNDPGPLEGLTKEIGGWVLKQWNFLPWEGPSTPLLPTSAGGIDAVGAWRNLMRNKRDGAQGVRIAVLDTGIAYRALGTGFRRSPDFSAKQFVKGYDFVAGDRLPLDENGHGTHVAGTIGEKTNNGVGLTGLAYRARLLPVRVLDEHGSGSADDIARGIRFAVKRGADVINMSFNFGCGKRVPGIDEELRRAYRGGVVAVASIGNRGAEGCVSPPATGPRVIGVGGTTQGGCLGSYSLSGKGVDIVAPGGGTPAPGCPSILSSPIFQVTFKGDSRRTFGQPGDYVGTSMAAAHVSGAAAMVIASAAIPRVRKSAKLVRVVTSRLLGTARSIGLTRAQQGGGLLDAGAATDSSVALPR
jgi:serine protease